MSSESPPSRNPAGHSGLLDNALGLLSATIEFFEVRFAVLAEESKYAALQLLILVGCVMAALVVALMHFIIAGVLLLVARSRITKPMLQDTRDELKKDREWLKTLNQP